MSETLSLVEQVKAAMKAAMKAREKETLSTIRLIQAEFKRVEVDERIEIDDARALAIMDKMVKQRRDSASQYRDADRPELADIEDAEIAIIQTFLPAQLSAEEIDALIDEALAGAQHILETRRDSLLAITHRLIEVESIDAEELASIMNETSPGPTVVPGTSVPKPSSEENRSSETVGGDRPENNSPPASTNG